MRARVRAEGSRLASCHATRRADVRVLPRGRQLEDTVVADNNERGIEMFGAGGGVVGLSSDSKLRGPWGSNVLNRTLFVGHPQPCPDCDHSWVPNTPSECGRMLVSGESPGPDHECHDVGVRLGLETPAWIGAVVDGSTFLNYDRPRMVAVGGFAKALPPNGAGYDFSFSGAMEVRFANTSWVQANHRVRWRWPDEMVFVDADGTFVAQDDATPGGGSSFAGASVLHDALAADPNANGECYQDERYGGTVCGPQHRYIQVGFLPPDPNLELQGGRRLSDDGVDVLEGDGGAAAEAAVFRVARELQQAPDAIPLDQAVTHQQSRMATGNTRDAPVCRMGGASRGTLGLETPTGDWTSCTVGGMMRASYREGGIYVKDDDAAYLRDKWRPAGSPFLVQMDLHADAPKAMLIGEVEHPIVAVQGKGYTGTSEFAWLDGRVAWVGPRALNFSFDFIDPYDGSTKLGHWVEATLAADGASLAFVNGSDWGTTEDPGRGRPELLTHLVWHSCEANPAACVGNVRYDKLANARAFGMNLANTPHFEGSMHQFLLQPNRRYQIEAISGPTGLIHMESFRMESLWMESFRVESFRMERPPDGEASGWRASGRRGLRMGSFRM